MAMVGRMSTRKHMSTGQLSEASCSHTVLLFHNVLEGPWNKVTPRIHGDDLLLVAPLGEGPNLGSRLRVCEIGPGDLRVRERVGLLLSAVRTYDRR